MNEKLKFLKIQKIIDLAERKFNENLLWEAENLIKKAIELDPKISHSHFILSQILEKKGILKHALKEAEIALKLRPEWEEAIYQFVKLTEKTGEKNKYKDFSKNINYNTKIKLEKLKNKEYLSEFIRFFNSNEYRKAFDIGEKILNLKSYDMDTISKLKNPWIKNPLPNEPTFKKSEELEKHFKKLLNFKTEKFKTWKYYYLSALHSFIKRTNENPYIIEFLRSSNGKKSYGWMFNNYARYLLNECRYEKAVKYFKICLKFLEEDWISRCLLAEALICGGRRREGFKEFHKALSLSDSDTEPQIRTWLGEFYLFTGEYDKALQELNRAIEKNVCYAYCWRGISHMMLGKYDLAIKDFEYSLKYNPYDIEAKICLAETLRKKNKFYKALKILNKTVKEIESAELYSWLWPAYANRIILNYHFKKYKEVLEDYKKIDKEKIDFIERKTGTKPLNPHNIKKIAEDLLAFSKAVRRADKHLNDLWMK